MGAADLDEAALRRQGIAALAELRARFDSADIGERVRARRVARMIVLDHYRAKVPAGMRLVPGVVQFVGKRVRMKGGCYLAVHEVLVREFREFASRVGNKSQQWAGLDAAQPIVRVALTDARAYVAWKKARLPTRDELLRAASVGGHAAYPWGPRFEAHRLNTRESGLGRTQVPGAHPAGASPNGIHDLLGNVAEWTSTPAPGGKGRYCVVGGSYMSHGRRAISGKRFTTYRLRPTESRNDVGMRLARSLPLLPGS